MRYGNGEEVTEKDVLSCVGPGWHKLVSELIHDLLKLGWNGELHQVKEKFGTLRFYVGECSPEVFDRIEQAERLSMITCEDCGSLGESRRGPWIRTLCDRCAKGKEPLKGLLK
jgi:hypothetical protein